MTRLRRVEKTPSTSINEFYGSGRADTTQMAYPTENILNPSIARVLLCPRNFRPDLGDMSFAYLERTSKCTTMQTAAPYRCLNLGLWVPPVVAMGHFWSRLIVALGVFGHFCSLLCRAPRPHTPGRPVALHAPARGPLVHPPAPGATSAPPEPQISRPHT